MKYTEQQRHRDGDGLHGHAGPRPAPFDFGDGCVSGSVACATGASHTYATPSHYTVTVHAKNAAGETSFSRRQTVVNPPTATQPTRSTPIVYDDTRTPNRLTVVNPDRNSVRCSTLRR